MKTKLILLATLLGMTQVTKPLESPISEIVPDIAMVSLPPAILAGSIGLKYWLDTKAESLQKNGNTKMSKVCNIVGNLGLGVGLLSLYAYKAKMSGSLREIYFWMLLNLI